MRQQRLFAVLVWLCGSWVIAGCAAERIVWQSSPSAIGSAQPQQAADTETAASSTGVLVRVSGAEEKEATAGALSEAIAMSLQAALQAEGVGAMTSGTAPYTLSCTLQHADVVRTRRVADALTYQLAAQCTLTQGTETIWQDTMTQRYDETVFVNTMSRLPPSYEAPWTRECFLPWRTRVVWRTAHAIQRRAALAASPPMHGTPTTMTEARETSPPVNSPMAPTSP